MPSLVPARRQVAIRVVYVGPGVGGKTTNLRKIANEFPEYRMTELPTAGDRTMGGDFLPVAAGLPTIDGWTPKLSLSGVPGQIQYRDTRADLLKNADVVVFVADSQERRMDANLYAMEDVRSILRTQSRDADRTPLVLQYNKMDLEDALTEDEMNRQLNPGAAPWRAAVALRGIGVFETLGDALQLAVREAEAYVAATSARPLVTV